MIDPMLDFDLVVDAVVTERTEWGITTVLRLVSETPRMELKLTCWNEDVDVPLKEGDSVTLCLSGDYDAEEEGEEEPFPLPPGPDGTQEQDYQPNPFCSRCEGKGFYYVLVNDSVEGEPCDCVFGD